jgi:hypothetical protein
MEQNNDQGVTKTSGMGKTRSSKRTQLKQHRPSSLHLAPPPHHSLTFTDVKLQQRISR